MLQSMQTVTRLLITRLTEQTFAIAFSGVMAGNGVVTGTILRIISIFTKSTILR